MNTTVDYGLFLALNFDGGAFMDWLMLTFSGKLTWVPLYLLFMWLIYRKAGWRNMLLFLVLAALSIVFTDMVAGAFKHTGLLKNILPDLGVRLRPMYTPELEGMVHVVKLGGKYGSISAHAATTCTVALLASLILQRRWIWCISAFWVVAVCYSRVYLAYHFPLDILYGVLLGLCFGAISYLIYASTAHRLMPRDEVEDKQQ